MKSKNANPVSNNKDIADELESVNEARLHNKKEELDDSAKEDALSTEDELKKQLDEANDKYLRLYAEFDNFRRRTSKERVEMLQSAGKEVISDLLPVLDDLERALKAMDNSEDVTSLKEGVQLVASKLIKTLQQKGLKEMESINHPFDPDVHEAVTNIPAPSDDMKGKVIDEVVKGYFLNDKVLRYAKVIVGS